MHPERRAKAQHKLRALQEDASSWEPTTVFVGTLRFAVQVKVNRPMADTRPTQVSFFEALKLCALLLFSPRRFKELEVADQQVRNNYADRAEPPHRAEIVRAAFTKSFLLVLGFSVVGYALGGFMDMLGRCATSGTVGWLQVVGAGLLLWGTLFVRGWEVLSFSGVQLTELVNQWLYRALYCVGTAVIVYSLSFPQCGAR
jgi:hypothetical protein